jgi:hypothetical protein
LNGTANTGTVKAATFTGTHTFSAGNLLHGTYTPTLTNVSNAGSLTAAVCQYMRLGNVVTVSGLFIVTPTVPATSTQVGISLPIASTFGGATQCGGAGMQTSTPPYEPLAIYADVFNNRAEALFTPSSTISRALSFTFTYRVL